MHEAHTWLTWCTASMLDGNMERMLYHLQILCTFQVCELPTFKDGGALQNMLIVKKKDKWGFI